MKSLNSGRLIWIAIFGLSICATALGNENSTEHQNTGFSFSVFTLIEILGVCAITCLLITFLTGLFRRKLGRRFLMVHRAFAWLTIILALSHGITVMIVF